VYNGNPPEHPPGALPENEFVQLMQDSHHWDQYNDAHRASVQERLCRMFNSFLEPAGVNAHLWANFQFQMNVVGGFFETESIDGSFYVNFTLDPGRDEDIVDIECTGHMCFF
jgi:hypothetical protein